MRHSRLLMCAVSARQRYAPPTVSVAEDLLRHLLRTAETQPMPSLSSSTLVSCVAAMEWRRQADLREGRLSPSDCMLSRDMIQFLAALDKTCEGRFALVERLWSSVHLNDVDTQRVTAAAKTLLGELRFYRSFARGNGGPSPLPGGLLRLELNLLETIARVEGEVNKDVKETCYCIQQMRRALNDSEANSFSSAERKAWIRRMRRLTTLVYPRLQSCSPDEEEAFKEALRCLYRTSEDKSKPFGLVNKMQYSLCVLCPYLARNASDVLRSQIRKTKSLIIANMHHDPAHAQPIHKSTKTGKLDNDTSNKITAVVVLLGSMWYFWSPLRDSRILKDAGKESATV